MNNNLYNSSVFPLQIQMFDHDEPFPVFSSVVLGTDMRMTIYNTHHNHNYSLYSLVNAYRILIVQERKHCYEAKNNLETLIFYCTI